MSHSRAPAEDIYEIHGGLATFGPEMLAVRGALEKRILAWAEESGARPMLFPPLVSAKDLGRFDYFRNFPHLAVVASRIRSEVLTQYSEDKDRDVETVPQQDLSDGRYVLPSAACYNVYLHLEGTVLEGPRYITTVATCFRNENAYEELQRLWSFSMREIVCVGEAEAVKEHLQRYKDHISSFAEEIGLSLEIRFATDPFYQPQSSTARMQKLFPQKEEFVYGDTLAIASLNFHRNFFGERCDIRMADGSPAFSGCVAFGLERWFHALLERYGNDTGEILRVLG